MQFKLEFENLENSPEVKNIIDNFNSEAKAVFDRVLKEHQCCLPCFIDKVKKRVKTYYRTKFSKIAFTENF